MSLAKNPETAALHAVAHTQPEKMIFGIQGGKGSFNEEAIHHYLQEHPIRNAEIRYLYTSDAVMAALSRGEIDFGQCAIYNSAGGFVEETTQALEKYQAQTTIKTEKKFTIKISHALMIRPDQDFENIDTVMCHPQVLAQCKKNLAQRYPQFKQMSGEGALIDNAKTAEALSLGNLPNNVAVMGSRVLAELYHLKIVADNLQDLAQNHTEFIILSKA